MRSLKPIQLLAGLLFLSCIAPQLYHDQPEPCSVDSEKDCSRAYVEKHPEYVLGFVEFDDLGWAWDREQGRVLWEALQTEAKDNDLLMVVFAHGWKHNASTCDTNVSCFRETLRGLHATEQKLKGDKARRIVGIYVGWRGLSSRGRLLTQTTFFGRKGTAHQVGSGAVTELIVRLKELREQKRRDNPRSSTRLVTVGHSFGGALIFSATSQLMMERLVVAAHSPDDKTVRGLGDLVILVNPAFEAARYQPLHATLNEKTREPYGDTQNPVFTIFTSVGDRATGKAFPLGRFFSAKFDDYRTDGRRALQRESNRKAVGHFEPFRTHYLKPNKGTEEPEKVNDARMANCGCPFSSAGGLVMATQRNDAEVMSHLQAQGWPTADAPMVFPTATLLHDKGSSNSPIQVVSVDNKIITGHNDIYRPAFIDFLRYYILMSTEPE